MCPKFLRIYGGLLYDRFSLHDCTVFQVAPPISPRSLYLQWERLSSSCRRTRVCCTTRIPRRRERKPRRTPWWWVCRRRWWRRSRCPARPSAPPTARLIAAPPVPGCSSMASPKTTTPTNPSQSELHHLQHQDAHQWRPQRRRPQQIPLSLSSTTSSTRMLINGVPKDDDPNKSLSIWAPPPPAPGCSSMASPKTTTPTNPSQSELHHLQHQDAHQWRPQRRRPQQIPLSLSSTTSSTRMLINGVPKDDDPNKSLSVWAPPPPAPGCSSMASPKTTTPTNPSQSEHRHLSTRMLINGLPKDDDPNNSLSVWAPPPPAPGCSSMASPKTTTPTNPSQSELHHHQHQDAHQWRPQRWPPQQIPLGLSSTTTSTRMLINGVPKDDDPNKSLSVWAPPPPAPGCSSMASPKTTTPTNPSQSELHHLQHQDAHQWRPQRRRPQQIPLSLSSTTSSTRMLINGVPKDDDPNKSLSVSSTTSSTRMLINGVPKDDVPNKSLSVWAPPPPAPGCSSMASPKTTTPTNPSRSELHHLQHQDAHQWRPQRRRPQQIPLSLSSTTSSTRMLINGVPKDDDPNKSLSVWAPPPPAPGCSSMASPKTTTPTNPSRSELHHLQHQDAHQWRPQRRRPQQIPLSLSSTTSSTRMLINGVPKDDIPNKSLSVWAPPPPAPGCSSMASPKTTTPTNPSRSELHHLQHQDAHQWRPQRRRPQQIPLSLSSTTSSTRMLINGVPKDDDPNKSLSVWAPPPPAPGCSSMASPKTTTPTNPSQSELHHLQHQDAHQWRPQRRQPQQIPLCLSSTTSSTRMLINGVPKDDDPNKSLSVWAPPPPAPGCSSMASPKTTTPTNPSQSELHHLQHQDAHQWRPQRRRPQQIPLSLSSTTSSTRMLINGVPKDDNPNKSLSVWAPPPPAPGCSSMASPKTTTPTNPSQSELHHLQHQDAHQWRPQRRRPQQIPLSLSSTTSSTRMLINGAPKMTTPTNPSRSELHKPQTTNHKPALPQQRTTIPTAVSHQSSGSQFSQQIPFSLSSANGKPALPQ